MATDEDLNNADADFLRGLTADQFERVSAVFKKVEGERNGGNQDLAKKVAGMNDIEFSSFKEKNGCN